VGQLDEKVAHLLRSGWPTRIQAIDEKVRRAVGDV
jgi:hypothetical protein